MTSQESRSEIKLIPSDLQISLEDNNLLDCLQKQIDSIEDNDCRKEIFKISEFQGESITLDKSLLKSCRTDKARFCSDLENHVDEESVYRCLQEFSNDLSSEVMWSFYFTFVFVKYCAENVVILSFAVSRRNLQTRKIGSKGF